MHELLPVNVDAGWGIWVCPACGRSLRLTWVPGEHSEVLAVGDGAPHTASGDPSIFDLRWMWCHGIIWRKPETA